MIKVKADDSSLPSLGSVILGQIKEYNISWKIGYVECFHH
jgi:hypothetical protein